MPQARPVPVSEPSASKLALKYSVSWVPSAFVMWAS
jgi:hypothetical protein